MGMFDFTPIPWMNDHDPAAAAAVSAASHNFNAARDRAQRQDEFQAKFPLWVQEQQNQARESQLRQTVAQNTMDDRNTMAAWLQGNGATPSGILNSTPPIMKTAEGQRQLSELMQSTAHSFAGNALMQRQTELIKSAAQLITEGGPDAFVMGNNGQPSVNSQVLTDGWKQVTELKRRKDTVDKISPESRLLREAEQEELMAEQSRQAGNTAEYQKRISNAEKLRSEVGKGGGGIEVGMDDNNRPIVRIGGGGRAGAPGATVGTLSKGQEKLVKYENATQLLNTLSNNLRPADVGAAGVAGEWIADRTLAQIPGFESALSGQRVENRALLGAARESLMREISDDTRFSNKDREDIAKILPSSGVFESHGDAMKRIETVRGILAQRARTYAERVGEPVPLFAQSKEEIRDNTRKRVAAIQSSLQSGTITKEQSDAEIKREQDAALNALIKFH